MQGSIRCLLTGIMILILAGVPTGVRAQEPLVHEVQPGENLFRISLRYKVSMDVLMDVNGLTDPARIYSGQELIIPDQMSEPLEMVSVTPAFSTHVVERGETLDLIAVQYQVSVWALAQTNQLTDTHTLFAGQQIIIPTMLAPDGELENTVSVNQAQSIPVEELYEVKPGETLTRIALQFHTTAAELARLNSIMNPSTIYAGQKLRLVEAAPRLAGQGKRILVDISEQHLYAYKDEQLVYSFIISSGAAPSLTRTGQFQVQSKIDRAYGTTWDIWMPFWLGIYWAGGSENGIHALPILPSGQTLWAGYLGTPISYGCIVLGTQEAELLYQWAEIGTPVVIQS